MVHGSVVWRMKAVVFEFKPNSVELVSALFLSPFPHFVDSVLVKQYFIFYNLLCSCNANAYDMYFLGQLFTVTAVLEGV